MSNIDEVIDVTVKTTNAAINAVSEKAEDLKTVGWVSYLLHLIVAVAAVVPGANVGVALLVIALVIDLVKKGDAAGTWQESHFSWRIRTVIWAGILYVVTIPLLLLFVVPGCDRLGHHFDLVLVPHRARHGGDEQQPSHWRLNLFGAKSLTMHHDENCLFCKIIAGKIPSRKVYEDDDIFAFHDINPWAPVHFLIDAKESH